VHQMSFAFLDDIGQITRETSNLWFAHNASGVTLRRIDPARNMSRFYSLEVERDLLGNVVLVRRWGRIGSAGKIRLDAHAGEGEAFDALHALQNAKKRRGYQPTTQA